MNTPPPVLQIRRREGENWFVAATWPDGRFEEIEGFKTAKKFQTWLDERGESGA